MQLENPYRLTRYTNLSGWEKIIDNFPDGIDARNLFDYWVDKINDPDVKSIVLEVWDSSTDSYHLIEQIKFFE